MQAIKTAYCGPTNTKGSRVIAKCDAGKVVVGWDYSCGIEPNHKLAVDALLAKLEWGGSWWGGQLPDGGYAWVCVGNDRDAPTVAVHR